MTYLHIVPLFIGTTELVLIAGTALLLFGGKKLPEMMRGLGQGISEFKKAANDAKAPLKEATEDIKDIVEDTKTTNAPSPPLGEGRPSLRITI